MTKLGFKTPLIAGMVLIAGGLIWFSQVPSHGGHFYSDILGPSLLAAVGLGFRVRAGHDRGVSGIQPNEAGLASGLINTSQQVGGALGLAILATIANSAPRTCCTAPASTLNRADQGL